ncbi:MAG: DUF4870 domain-containing protein [Candidatus Melainabacteria bacterium]|nr:DUF4870 domain-containing protein [Candidatus Melainabacteria bacterium]
MTTQNSNDNALAGVAYLGLILCMVPTVIVLVLKFNDSRFVKFHCIQALALGIASILINIALSIISLVPGVGIVFGLLGIPLSLGMLLGVVVLAVLLFQGKDIRIPALADFIDANLMGGA